VFEPHQRVKVNLSGLTIQGVAFSQNVQEALATIVRRRYGQHLTDKQLEAVTLELENRLQGGKRLRDSKLANADEPDFTFKA